MYVITPSSFRLAPSHWRDYARIQQVYVKKADDSDTSSDEEEGDSTYDEAKKTRRKLMKKRLRLKVRI